VVSAVSGTGKTTVCHRLIERNRERGGPPLSFSVSHTTRRQRSEEREGVDYYFVSPEEFGGLVERDAFLEWAVYNGNCYGTSWSAIEEPLAQGNDVLLEIEVQGARQVRRRRKDARFLFLLPPSLAVLQERLRTRGTDTAEQIASRLERSREELAAAEDFDYAVVNDELEECVESVLAIIGAEHSGETEALRRRFAPWAAVSALRGRGRG